jgi:restriction endonuclease S subunit
MEKHKESIGENRQNAIPNAKTSGSRTPNVPALRFPEFTGEWRFVHLEEVAEFQKQRIFTALLNNGNYISTENILQNFEGIQYSSSIPANTNVIEYQKGDILLSNIRPYLKKVWFADRKGGCSADVFVLRGDKCDQHFLYYVIASNRFINYVMSGAKGVKMPRGDKSQMEKYAFSIPTNTEQRKIAKFLSMLDERIRLQNKIIEKYESLIQALCDTLIEQETQQVTLSFSDFGQSYSGLSGKSAEDFGDGYPFITYMNVYQNQIIDLTDVGLVKINETEQQSVVRHGDILLTLSSETPEEVGMGAVYLGETYPLYLNSFCFGIHIIDEAKIYPPFLAYYVSSQSFRKAVYPLAQGSTRFNLQKSDFMKKKFSFPVIEKQQKIYSILNSYSDKLIVERQIMKSLCYQKCYLLRQLFI